MNDTSENQPIRILELRAADGAGGGPEKTILRGARLSDPAEFQIHIVYLTGEGDSVSEIRKQADEIGVEFAAFTSKGKFDFSQLRNLREYVRDNDIQIVHSHEYKSNYMAVQLRKSFPNLKILSTAHGWTGHSWKERFLYYPIDKRLLKSFPQLISVSSEITGELVRKGVDSDRITTIPNSIEPEKFQRCQSLRANFRGQHSLSDDTFVIGAVGRLERQKRFDLLIDAINSIVKSGSGDNLQLLIAGEGSLKSPLEAQIQQLDIGQHVRMLGHVSDIRSLYSGMDLFVQSSDYEGTSNAVLEAMAMEVPIVATTAGGTEDIVTHQEHGILIPTGDHRQIESGIKTLVSSDTLAAELAASARKRVESELSFQNRNSRLERIYESLVGQPSSTPVPATVAQ